MADAGGAAAPSGYHTVTPRLVVHDVDSVVSFLRGVFDAVGTVDAGRPVELLIGDSIVMVSGAGVRQPFPAFLYVYVEDAEAAYRRALSAGAESLEAPLDTPYGDRRAMAARTAGNVYQIAHRMTEPA